MIIKIFLTLSKETNLWFTSFVTFNDVSFKILIIYKTCYFQVTRWSCRDHVLTCVILIKFAHNRHTLNFIVNTKTTILLKQYDLCSIHDTDRTGVRSIFVKCFDRDHKNSSSVFQSINAKDRWTDFLSLLCTLITNNHIIYKSWKIEHSVLRPPRHCIDQCSNGVPRMRGSLRRACRCLFLCSQRHTYINIII